MDTNIWIPHFKQIRCDRLAGWLSAVSTTNFKMLQSGLSDAFGYTLSSACDWVLASTFARGMAPWQLVNIRQNYQILSRSLWPKRRPFCVIPLTPCLEPSTIFFWYFCFYSTCSITWLNFYRISSQVKPTLDVMQVPEFFVLLNSTELPDIRSQHRVFLFQLLRDGLRSRMDYLVCARRRVFRILLSLQPSTLLADHASKSLVLSQMMSRFC